MTMTSLEPTSRCAIRPSGDTFDLVRPGMSKVVGLIRGVEAPEAEDFLLAELIISVVSIGVGGAPDGRA